MAQKLTEIEVKTDDTPTKWFATTAKDQTGATVILNVLADDDSKGNEAASNMASARGLSNVRDVRHVGSAEAYQEMS